MSGIEVQASDLVVAEEERFETWQGRDVVHFAQVIVSQVNGLIYVPRHGQVLNEGNVISYY